MPPEIHIHYWPRRYTCWVVIHPCTTSHILLLMHSESTDGTRQKNNSHLTGKLLVANHGTVFRRCLAPVCAHVHWNCCAVKYSIHLIEHKFPRQQQNNSCAESKQQTTSHLKRLAIKLVPIGPSDRLGNTVVFIGTDSNAFSVQRVNEYHSAFLLKIHALFDGTCSRKSLSLLSFPGWRGSLGKECESVFHSPCV